MKTKRSAFNLIELTLAIAVVGIGIASVMALFIPAMNASKASVADNYLPDVADTLMTFVKMNSDGVKKENTVSNLDSLKKELHTSKYTVLKEISFNDISKTYGLYDTDTHSDYLWGVKVGTDGADFTGHILMWYTDDVKDLYDAGIPTEDSNKMKTNHRRYYIEVSWPLLVPYAQREKRLYVTELSLQDAITPER